MSHLILFYTNPKNVSKFEKETLTDIYETSLLNRPVADTFLKFLIIGICVINVIRTLHIAFIVIKCNISFIFTLIACFNEISVVAYISCFFLMQNTVFRSQPIPGSNACPNQLYTLLEMFREITFRWSSKSVKWLTVFICLLHLDYINKKEWLIDINRRSPALRLILFSILLVIFSGLTEFLEFIPTPINEECQRTKASVLHEVSTLVLDEIGPTIFILWLVVMVKIEIEREARVARDIKKRKIENLSIGKRMKRKMTVSSLILVEEPSSQYASRRAVFYLLILILVGILPSKIRHLLILAGQYDTRNYLLDEKICDFFNGFILICNLAPVVFCCNLKRRIVFYERSSAVPTLNNSQTSFMKDDQKDSNTELNITLKDVLSMERFSLGGKVKASDWKQIQKAITNRELQPRRVIDSDTLSLNSETCAIVKVQNQSSIVSNDRPKSRNKRLAFKGSDDLSPSPPPGIS